MPASLEVSQTRIERPELTARLTDSLDRGSVVPGRDRTRSKTVLLNRR